MAKTNTIAALAIIFSLSVIFLTSFEAESFAESQEDLATTEQIKQNDSWRVPGKLSVNNVMIKVTAMTKDGLVEYDTFTEYNQIGGFKRGLENGVLTEKPSFKLAGLVGPEKHYLYEMADYYYSTGQFRGNNDYKDNTFLVSLLYNDIPVRSFEYSNCDMVNYNVETLTDGIYTYQEDQGMGIALVDYFEFQCDGYTPHNNYYGTLEKQNPDKPNTQSSLDYQIKQKELYDRLYSQEYRR